MISETPILNSVAIFLSITFIILVFIKIKMLLKILEHMKEHFKYFYDNITHRAHSNLFLITSGKGFYVDFKLFTQKKYQLDKYLEKKINIYKQITIVTIAIFLILILLLIQIKIIIIPNLF